MLPVIAKASHAIFVPATCAAARVIVRKIVPGIPICTVVFSHGSPGALAKIRTPAMPIGLTSVIFYQATLFRVGDHAQVARAKSVHQDTFVPWFVLARLSTAQFPSGI